MTLHETITGFLAQKKLALVRASRKISVRGVSISKELEAKGYTVSIVYLDEESPGCRLKD